MSLLDSFVRSVVWTTFNIQVSFTNDVISVDMLLADMLFVDMLLVDMISVELGFISCCCCCCGGFKGRKKASIFF